MKVTYFKDTDTAVVELIDAPVEETRELNENVYFDLDARGNLRQLDDRTCARAREPAGDAVFARRLAQTGSLQQ